MLNNNFNCLIIMGTLIFAKKKKKKNEKNNVNKNISKAYTSPTDFKECSSFNSFSIN